MTLLAEIPPPPFDGFTLGPLNVRLYGLLIAIGAILALMLVVRRYERYGGDPADAEKAGLLAVGGGLVGARIGYIIPRFLGDGGFIEDPLAMFAIWRGGLTFFGGLAGGALAVIVFVRVKRLRLPAMADAVAPALPLAQAIGRWGNYFNQELFGRPTDLPWALRVEPTEASIPPEFAGETTFHPTFLYESLWNAALVGVILGIERAGWLKRRGSLLFVYLIGYGIGRGWIEALRVDTAERYLGLSRNNWIAILVVIIGIVGLLWWERRETAPLTTEDPEPPRLDADAEDSATAGDDAGAGVTDASDATATSATETDAEANDATDREVRDADDGDTGSTDGDVSSEQVSDDRDGGSSSR